MNIGCIGYGYWGPNLVRNFDERSDCTVWGVADLNEERRAVVREKHPQTFVFAQAKALIIRPEIDAVVIATPVETHYDLARLALLNGKHVLVEKPMTDSIDQAVELVEIAHEKGLVLLTDHVFCFHPAIRFIKQFIQSGALGNIQYLDSTRINLGLFQTHTNVRRDLAVHDIAIFNYLLEQSPIQVSGAGWTPPNYHQESTSYLNLQYPNGVMGHIHSSWVSPVKIRRMLIGGDKRMIVFNDLETTEKVKIYDSSYRFLPDEKRSELLVDYRVGDIQVPKIEQREALSVLAEEFLQAIREGRALSPTPWDGLSVVRTIADSEIRGQKAPVDVDYAKRDNNPQSLDIQH